MDGIYITWKQKTIQALQHEVGRVAEVACKPNKLLISEAM